MKENIIYRVNSFDGDDTFDVGYYSTPEKAIQAIEVFSKAFKIDKSQLTTSVIFLDKYYM